MLSAGKSLRMTAHLLRSGLRLLFLLCIACKCGEALSPAEIQAIRHSKAMGEGNDEKVRNAARKARVASGVVESGQVQQSVLRHEASGNFGRYSASGRGFDSEEGEVQGGQGARPVRAAGDLGYDPMDIDTDGDVQDEGFFGSDVPVEMWIATRSKLSQVSAPWVLPGGGNAQGQKVHDHASDHKRSVGGRWSDDQAGDMQIQGRNDVDERMYKGDENLINAAGEKRGTQERGILATPSSEPHSQTETSSGRTTAVRFRGAEKYEGGKALLSGGMISGDLTAGRDERLVSGAQEHQRESDHFFNRGNLKPGAEGNSARRVGGHTGTEGRFSLGGELQEDRDGDGPEPVQRNKVDVTSPGRHALRRALVQGAGLVGSLYLCLCIPPFSNFLAHRCPLYLCLVCLHSRTYLPIDFLFVSSMRVRRAHTCTQRRRGKRREREMYCGRLFGFRVIVILVVSAGREWFERKCR